MTNKQTEPTEAQLRAIATKMLGMKNNEAAVILMLRLMLMFGTLAGAWSLPRITRHRFEYAVPGGRADLVLFHADDSVTVVEAKAEGNERVVLAGVGQVCAYASQMERVLIGGKPPKAIRRVLCCPREPEQSILLVRACHLAGVWFAPLPTFDTFKGWAARLSASPA